MVEPMTEYLIATGVLTAFLVVVGVLARRSADRFGYKSDEAHQPSP